MIENWTMCMVLQNYHWSIELSINLACSKPRLQHGRIPVYQGLIQLLVTFTTKLQINPILSFLANSFSLPPVNIWHLFSRFLSSKCVFFCVLFFSQKYFDNNIEFEFVKHFRMSAGCHCSVVFRPRRDYSNAAELNTAGTWYVLANKNARF